MKIKNFYLYIEYNIVFLVPVPSSLAQILPVRPILVENRVVIQHRLLLLKLNVEGQGLHLLVQVDGGGRGGVDERQLVADGLQPEYFVGFPRAPLPRYAVG